MGIVCSSTSFTGSKQPSARPLISHGALESSFTSFAEHPSTTLLYCPFDFAGPHLLKELLRYPLISTSPAPQAQPTPSLI